MIHTKHIKSRIQSHWTRINLRGAHWLLDWSEVTRGNIKVLKWGLGFRLWLTDPLEPHFRIEREIPFLPHFDEYFHQSHRCQKFDMVCILPVSKCQWINFNSILYNQRMPFSLHVLILSVQIILKNSLENRARLLHSSFFQITYLFPFHIRLFVFNIYFKFLNWSNKLYFIDRSFYNLNKTNLVLFSLNQSLIIQILICTIRQLNIVSVDFVSINIFPNVVECRSI